MKSSETVFRILMLILLTLCLSAFAMAPPLTFTFNDVIAPGAKQTDSYAINDAGVIAGDYIDSADVQHGMILNGTNLTTVDNAKCTTTSLSFYGINSAGTVVGWCFSKKTAAPLSFTYANGKFATVAYPKASWTEASGINDKGEVVGFYYANKGGLIRGFSLIKKKYKEINVKGAVATEAWGVNNAGSITLITGGNGGGAGVTCSSTTPCVSYVLTGKNLTKISDPSAGPDGTAVHTPDNMGDVDGTVYDSAGNRHGFLLHGGTYYDFDDPDGTNQTRADGLNDSLQLVGRYTDSANVTHGFIAQAQ
jgi:hypothetical protein